MLERHAKRSEPDGQISSFGVCPRFGPRVFDKKWQIRTVRTLWSDVDDTSDLNELAGRCDDAELPQPPIVVGSGRRLHAYWLLSQPWLVDDVGDPRPVHVEWVEVPGSRKPREYFTEPGSDEKLWLDAPSNVPDLSPKPQHVEDVLSGIAKLIGGDHTADPKSAGCFHHGPSGELAWGCAVVDSFRRGVHVDCGSIYCSA